MFPYPNQFPAEEVKVLLPILRGAAPDLKTAAHATWVLIGYGAAQISDGAGTEIKMASDVDEKTQVANYLEMGLGDGVTIKPEMSIPWKTILPILWELFKSYLGSKTVVASTGSTSAHPLA